MGKFTIVMRTETKPS